MNLNASVFSVIIPTFNRNHLIRDTLESVRAQKCRPIEVIVVDDGSTDDTVSSIISFKRELKNQHLLEVDDFFLSIYLQENSGVSAARNHGLRQSSGEYIYFLDSDDILDDLALSALKSEFSKSQCDMIFGGFTRFEHGTGVVTKQKIPKPTDDLVRDALRGTLWGNAARISMKREFALKIGPWNERLRLFEDREYSERAVLNAQSISVLPLSLARIREGAGPRQNDTLRTRAGRACRIYCEKRVANLALKHVPVGDAAWSEFRSRIYGLGLRSYAEGWLEHGRACKELADSMSATLDKKGLRRKFACSLGVLGGQMYVILGSLKFLRQ